MIDLRTRRQIAEYTFGTAETSLINDVTVTASGAWFTDSLQPRLYFVPTPCSAGPVRRARCR